MKRIILSVFAAAVTAAWAIPASAGDVTFSGQYRLRGEYIENNDFSDATNDANDFWAQRVRLTANAKATDDVSVKITLQDTRTWGAEGTTTAGSPGVSGPQLTDAGTSINSNVDIHEAYLNVTNIFGTPVSLRAGRQELAYGDERLIGSFGWNNNGRAFDAFKLMYSNDAVNVDAFTATISEGGSQSVVPTTGDDTYFSGVYATLKQLIPNNTLDVYLLNLNSGTSEAANIYTIGARVKGAAAGVDYTVELPFQFGEEGTLAGGSDISAWAFAAKAGYTLPTPMKIRVGAEYDFATGQDPDETDNTVFSNLFPTNHAHFGIADVTGANQWSNISAWSVNASVDLNEKLRLFVAYWDFTQDEAAGDDEIGSEIDVVATYKYNNNLNLEAGASRFFVGDALAVDGDDRDFAYLQITANF